MTILLIWSFEKIWSLGNSDIEIGLIIIVVQDAINAIYTELYMTSVTSHLLSKNICNTKVFFKPFKKG